MGAQDTMEQMVMRRPTFMTLPNNAIVRMMCRGNLFTGYAENKKGKFVKKQLLLFINPEHMQRGTLYWCSPGRKIESRNCCMPLRDITDIFLGKHTDVFESMVAQSAVEEHCFSLMSRNKAINLEAQNSE